jgi:hypothetical protein
MLRSVSLLTILTVAGLIGVYEVWLAWGAAGRIEPGLIERAEKEGTIPATVTLPFKPERFHVTNIQAEGRIRRVNGNVVELRSISADGIRTLARNYYWIERIAGI